MTTVRIVKKYSNRKLYDTTSSTYVTLHDLVEFVRKGDEVQVMDTVTQVDRTYEILASALAKRAEQEPLDNAAKEALLKIIRGLPPLNVLRFPTRPSESQTTPE